MPREDRGQVRCSEIPAIMPRPRRICKTRLPRPPPKRKRGGSEAGGKAAAQTFAPKVFRVSRLGDFATRSELIKQTGYPPENWPLVVIKELADNALDKTEEDGTPPEIEIIVTKDSITIADRGPALRPPPSNG